MLVPKLCFPKNPDPSPISHRIFSGCQSQPENGKVRGGVIPFRRTYLES